MAKVWKTSKRLGPDAWEDVLSVTFSMKEVRQFLENFAYRIDMDDPEWLIALVLDMKRFKRGDFTNG